MTKEEEIQEFIDKYTFELHEIGKNQNFKLEDSINGHIWRYAPVYKRKI